VTVWGLQQMPGSYSLQLDVSQHFCIQKGQASKPATASLCACSAGCNAVMRARTLRRCTMAAQRSSECKAWRLAAATTSECRLQTQSAEGSGAPKPASQPLACRHSRLASWNAVWMLTPCKRGSPCLIMLLCQAAAAERVDGWAM